MTPVRDWRECWPSVRKGLEAMLAKTGERELPEDFYLALATGNAHLHTFDGGFAILRRAADPDGAVLFVWALCVDKGAGKPQELDLYAALETIATGMGAKRIRMHSPRPGWGRLGYFSERSRIYERELEQLP